MIENKETAQYIIDTLRKCGADINESIIHVQKNCSEEEFNLYRRAMGKVMGEIFFEGFKPIFKKHPDLEPDSFK